MITTLSRVLRVRLRTLLVAIAFLGLVFAIFVQTVQRRQTEALLRAELTLARAQADANFQHARAAVDQYFTKVAEQAEAGGTQSADMRRDTLEQTLKLYEKAESNGATPEERARAGERVRQIRSQLDGEPQ
jgi:hypothetical protein